MKLPPIQASLHYERVRGLFHRQSEEPTYTPMPPIHEDLGGLSETEIQNEIRAIDARIEKGIIEPEGIDGLNYRRTRLIAQAQANQRNK